MSILREYIAVNGVNSTHARITAYASIDQTVFFDLCVIEFNELDVIVSELTLSRSNYKSYANLPFDNLTNEEKLLIYDRDAGKPAPTLAELKVKKTAEILTKFSQLITAGYYDEPENVTIGYTELDINSFIQRMKLVDLAAKWAVKPEAVGYQDMSKVKKEISPDNLEQLMLRYGFTYDSLWTAKADLDSHNYGSNHNRRIGVGGMDVNIPIGSIVIFNSLGIDNTFYSKAQRFFTRMPWTHACIYIGRIFDVGSVLSSDEIVTIAPYRNYCKDDKTEIIIYSVPITDSQQFDIINKLYIANSGKLYGFLQIPFFIYRWFMGIFRRNVKLEKNPLPDGVICSELVYNYMIEISELINNKKFTDYLNNWNSNTIHAGEVEMICKSFPGIFNLVFERKNK